MPLSWLDVEVHTSVASILGDLTTTKEVNFFYDGELVRLVLSVLSSAVIYSKPKSITFFGLNTRSVIFLLAKVLPLQLLALLWCAPVPAFPDFL